MNSSQAIAKLNALSSVDTEKGKRDEYKECICVIAHDITVLNALRRNLTLNGTVIEFRDGEDNINCKMDTNDYELVVEWMMGGTQDA